MHLTLRIIYKEYEKDYIYISNRMDSTRGLIPAAVPLCGIPFHMPHICSNNGFNLHGYDIQLKMLWFDHKSCGCTKNVCEVLGAMLLEKVLCVSMSSPRSIVSCLMVGLAIGLINHVIRLGCVGWSGLLS